MGRPIQKKYFGNTNSPQVGGESVGSVTIAGTWAGFTSATTTVTFSAPQIPGGVTATGTATIVAGAVTAVVITNAGGGYTSVPTVTIVDTDVGAETTGTATAVLTTTKQNAITMTGRVVAGSTVALDVIKQTGSRRYLVTDGTNTGVVKLVAAAVAAAGEAQIVATDSASGTYYVTKLTARRAVVVPGTGTQFSSGQSVPWTLGTATVNVSVKIPNA